MDTNASTCCSGYSCNCNELNTSRKKIVIDFLYLDLNVCSRCKGTESSLDEAIRDVSVVLNAAGFEIEANKININTRELAYKYHFMSSPTIKINGKDISIEVKESQCKDCGDLCGDDVDCRIWEYEGNEYNEPPKEMIVNAILQEIYNPGISTIQDSINYNLPKNLEIFFEGLESKI